MSKIKDTEYVMVSFRAYKTKKAATILNVFLNFLFDGVLGSGTKEFEFTLTNDNLYIDGIGYLMTGQVDVFYTEKIDRKEILSFNVVSEGTKEIITLRTTKTKPVIYTRDNEELSNLAGEMAKFISEKIGISE